MEGNDPAYSAVEEELPGGIPVMSKKAAPGTFALGLRQQKNLIILLLPVRINNIV